MSSKARSERWRARRRTGAIPITIDVLPSHRHALESMGLIEPGYDREPEALVWAVERFLNTAPAVLAIGNALFPEVPDAAEPEALDEPNADDFDTVSPECSG